MATPRFKLVTYSKVSGKVMTVSRPMTLAVASKAAINDEKIVDIIQSVPR